MLYLSSEGIISEIKMDAIKDAFSPFKYLNHIDRFLAIAYGRDVIPVMVELDLVNFCNHNCIWCSDLFHSRIFLEKEFVFKLLQEFKKIGVKSVLFKGGGSRYSILMLAKF